MLKNIVENVAITCVESVFCSQPSSAHINVKTIRPQHVRLHRTSFLQICCSFSERLCTNLD